VLALAGYCLFTLSTGVFLSLHSAQVLRVLPKPSRRGRDLGFFNLTNTVPSLVMPWLAVALIPTLGYTALFWVLAGLALIAPLILPRR
ncbi:MAG TPA: MFS transporter, partial [Qipengyuania sp.]|nr:MFS transporter [Qipengyuania sp.]